MQSDDYGYDSGKCCSKICMGCHPRVEDDSAPGSRERLQRGEAMQADSRQTGEIGRAQRSAHGCKGCWDMDRTDGAGEAEAGSGRVWQRIRMISGTMAEVGGQTRGRLGSPVVDQGKSPRDED